MINDFLLIVFIQLILIKIVLICENGKDFSRLMINPEILLSLGINRVDVVYLDCHGYWKRYPDYMDMQVPGVGRTIHNDCIKYVKLEDLNEQYGAN